MTVYPSTAKRSRRQPLSADYIRTVRLKTSGVLGRAYDMRAVDDLLDRIAADIVVRNDVLADRDVEIARLKGRVGHLEEEADARRYGRLPNAIRDEIPPDALNAQRQAQRESDKIMAAAQRGATQIAKAARKQAEQIVAHAAERSDTAAFGYRKRVPAGAYSADREEVERMRAVLGILLEMIESFHIQFGAYHTAIRDHLRKVRDRLDPAVIDDALEEEPALAG